MKTKLPLWRVFRLRFKLWMHYGGWTATDLHNALHKYNQAKYFNVQLTPYQKEFVYDDDARIYYREHMPYHWIANHTRGKVDLGICTQSEAMRRLAQQIPKSVVIYTDEIMPFIFFKMPEV